MSSTAQGSGGAPVVEGASIEFSLIAVTILSLVTGILFISQGQCKLEQRGYLEPSITPTLSMMLLAAMFILGSIGAFIGQNEGEAGSLTQLLWMYTISFAAQLPVIFAFKILRKCNESRHILVTTIVTFAVFVPLAHTVAGFLHVIFVSIGLEANEPLGPSTLNLFTQEPFGLPIIALILLVTIGAATVEEVMFRGLLFPALASVIGGRSMWKASIATSIIFALIHIGPAQPSAIAGLFFLSLGLCYARVKSGSVLSPILIHALFNAMNIAFVYSMDL